jgi:Rieske Fe-S protein
VVLQTSGDWPQHEQLFWHLSFFGLPPFFLLVAVNNRFQSLFREDCGLFDHYFHQKLDFMERKEFINKLTGGLAFTCVACMMEACSKDDTTPSGNSGGSTNTGGTTGPFTVNLNTQLLSVNDFEAGPGLIVVRIAAGNIVSSFVAFSSVCPHQGATVQYVKSNNTFNCSAHNSNFSISGAVTSGPAPTGLTKKTVEISGTTLTVR